MNTERKAIISSVFIAILFFITAITIFINYSYMISHGYLNEIPVEIQTKIQNLQDIEQLRNAALTVDNHRRAERKDDDALWVSGNELLISISIFAGLVSLLNIGFWIKYLREQRKENIPWWLKLF